MSGFGYSLIATPLLTLVMDARSAVVLNMLLGSTTHLLVLYSTRRQVDWRRAGIMALGSLPGVPIGSYLLSRLDPAMIKLAIAVLVIPFSVLLVLGHSRRFRRDSAGCGVSGFLGGALTSSTSLGGPPVVLFLLNQGLEQRAFVATLAVYFLFTTVLSIGAFLGLGLVTSALALQAAMLLPALWLGSYLGIRVLPRVNPAVFRRVVPALVSATALVILATVIRDM